nr:hypothetical protein Iba_chr01aCG19900 [Ipomoea batatas]
MFAQWCCAMGLTDAAAGCIEFEGQDLHTICKLFLFGFLGGSKVEWVEDAAGVAALVGRQAVALEDGVLVDAARVLDVLPPSDLYVVEQDELDDEQRGRGSKVLRLSGVVPLRNVDDSDLSEYLRQQHPRDAQHRPPIYIYLPSRYAGDGKPGSHSPFLASILKETLDEDVDALKETSLFSLPDDPVRNLVLEAHGRKTAAEACVTVAIFSDEDDGKF